MKISPEIISGFQPAKVYHENSNVINSMDFSEDGSLLITASDDESMILYHADTGSLEKKLFSKKYGVDKIRFTHQNNAVLCASKNNWDETIRYLSLHDNRYLRYFKGHRDRVVSLHLSPVNDSFASGSLDGTVRLWDLRQSGGQGILRLRQDARVFIGHSVATSFDPTGMIMSVAMGWNTIKLDTRNYDKGPFSTFTVKSGKDLYWNSMSFSPDGKFILLTTPEGLIIMDSFEGRLVQHITLDHQGPLRFHAEASFTPDGQFVLCGTEEGLVNVWDAESGHLVCVWRGESPHPGPVGQVLFNPKKMMAATACSQVALWLPESL